ncbi:hypothetical protein NLI96_g8617 [Meripilus lineatus]|uniref:GSKIP domain-containing protein n=1 Tax=Meripilus lineatus TaxID=2056292 RepID=A0AAD5YG17_9APHY|nr:hypothetical protein NLI96_g8617 [Physisporinus lineatus]
MDSQDPTNFTTTELERAISEQSFGISGYELLASESTEREASALVTLLEGKQINVSLTPRGFGFREIGPGTQDADDRDQTIFETIEDLLRSVSPLYVQAHGQALFRKLSEISARSFDDSEDT